VNKTSTPAKILVVDDEPDLESLIRQKFRRQIRSQEIHFEFADNGTTALERVKADLDIDIVFTDINMPQMDGLTLLSQLQKFRPTLKTVVISAYGDFGNIRAAMNRGAFDFLTKPIDLQDLETTTQRTLAKAIQDRQALEREQTAQAAQAALLTSLRQEVKERQQAEAALRDSEQRLAQILEALPVGVLVVDAQGYPRYTNQAAQQILGSETAWPLDMPWPQIAPAFLVGTDQPYPSAKQPIVRALDGESCTIDDLEFRKGEQIVPLEISATPILDQKGTVCFVISMLQDITHRKKAEADRIRFAQTEALLQQDNRELERLANCDSLTQLANRRRFDEYLQQEWRRLTREQVPLSLIMCDIDHFKAYNDTYGHQAGDACLQTVAKAIQKAVKRASDLVARYGGEEFVVILPHTDLEGAFQVAEVIQANVLKLELNHMESPVSPYVTLSIGIASMIPSTPKPFSNLVTAADLALYKAKHLGRNCITSAS
jgi:diguanylate cyclase (GGDEF)-like protein/PAS domain S-box-containing protein